jgi:hypothetical protein
MNPLNSFLLAMALTISAVQASAQQNPAALNPSISLSPVLGVGDEFDFRFNVGNNGTTAITGQNDFERMRFDITLGKTRPMVPNGPGWVSATGTDAISGAVLDYFDITYSEPINTFTGIQKFGVALDGGVMPEFIVHVMVTAASATNNMADIGASVDVTPNVMAQANNQIQTDDDIALFTNSISVILPITGISLKAVLQADKSSLQWQTISETQSDYFQVERSENGISYYPIGKVIAAGNSSTVTQYTFTDPATFSAAAYYRIRLYYKNGKTIVSNIETLTKKDGKVIRLFPNPAKNFVTLTGLKDNQTIIMADSKGSLIQQIKASGSSKHLNIELFAAGWYMINVIENGKLISSHKLIKN